MPVKYEQENNITYVVIENELCLPDSEYEQRMIEKNSIAGLLSMQVRRINNKIFYFYDITSRQTLSKVFAYSCVKWDDFVMVISELENAAKSVDEYMLGLDSLIISPEYIYLDSVRKRLEFIYFPGKCKEFSDINIEQEIKKLCDYLLERFDHDDKEHLMAVYEIYQRVIQNGYKVCAMTELLENFDTNNITGQGLNNTDQCNNEKNCDSSDFKNIIPDIIPPEIIEDETEEKNMKAIRAVNVVKILSALLFVAFIIKSFIPSILPVKINSTVSFIAAAVSALVYIALDKLPGELFAELKRRSVSQKYSPDKQEDVIHSEAEASADSFGKCLNDDKTGEFFTENEMEHTVLLSDYLRSMQKKEQQMRLIYDGEDETAENIYVDKLPYVIGSMGERCNHVVSSRLVSHIHMCILKIEDDYYIEDMNSTNGTWVNGKRIMSNERSCVRNGDEVIIATLPYKVEIT